MGVDMFALSAFCLIILVSNIIQGITGFAGTLIAMPFLIMLIDLETAKQVLNLLGILGSLWIISRDFQYVNWEQVKKILLIMSVGLIIGIVSYNYLPTQILLLLFPLFVLFVGLKGLFKNIKVPSKKKETSKVFDTLLLLAAGIIHGLFVSGGPLLVAYATDHMKNKHEFRATLSSVWLVLNSFMLIQSLLAGDITRAMGSYMLLAVIPLFMGIIVGGILLKKMSQKTFMLLSYGLLVFSGISLLL